MFLWFLIGFIFYFAIKAIILRAEEASDGRHYDGELRQYVDQKRWKKIIPAEEWTLKVAIGIAAICTFLGPLTGFVAIIFILIGIFSPSVRVSSRINNALNKPSKF